MADDRPSSYERINYSLRPAKAIERKMMCEAFRRLTPFGSVHTYRYVGFGSAYFSDFALFHRALGIHDMVSVEKDEANESRFVANRPFKCIRLEFGHSNDVLPRLNWDVRTIAWLDYDGRLTESVLRDVELVAARAVRGTVLVLSYNVNPALVPPPEDPDQCMGELRARFLGVLEGRIQSEWRRLRMGRFRRKKSPPRLDVDANRIAAERLRDLMAQVGASRVPNGVTGRELRGWGLSDVCRRVVTNEIQRVLADRNAGNVAQRIVARQIFNFQYADNARMGTVGFLFLDEGQVGHLDGLRPLDFVREADVPYRIEIPNLTFHEMRLLEAQLPGDVSSVLASVPAEQVEWFKTLYRYFPKFAEADI